MLGREASITCEALDTAILVDRRPVDNRVDIDGAHGANGDTIPARDAAIERDLHVDEYTTMLWLLRRAGPCVTIGGSFILYY